MTVDPDVSTVARVVTVSCAKCGGEMEFEGAEPGRRDLTAICVDCRAEILDRPHLPPPYRLVRELGRGGMGAVYLAWHPALEIERAVKIVLPRDAFSAEARRRFLAEARLHARLSHPRIVQVHDLSEPEPAVFAIVMEYVAGRDAGRVLREDGRPGLDPAVAVDIALDALEALAFVHAQGIVHCDVKDPNLLLAEPGRQTKLSDFGLARCYRAAGAARPVGAEGTSGTIAYMSPEQARDVGEAVPASDLFSVGATLYRLLSGCFPHEFPEGCDRLRVVREAAPVPLCRRRPGLPGPLLAVVDRALEREAGARWASAEEMGAALRVALRPATA